MKRIAWILTFLVVISCFSAYSSNDQSAYDKDYVGSNNDMEATELNEDSLSGVWNVVEGGDDHSIVIADGNIQIIDGNDSVICKYTKLSENVFEF